MLTTILPCSKHSHVGLSVEFITLFLHNHLLQHTLTSISKTTHTPDQSYYMTVNVKLNTSHSISAQYLLQIQHFKFHLISNFLWYYNKSKHRWWHKANRGLPLFGRLIGILATITDVFFGIKSSSLYSARICHTQHKVNWLHIKH